MPWSPRGSPLAMDFFYADRGYPIIAAGILTAIVSAIFGIISFSCFIKPFTRFSFHIPLVTTLALSAMLEAGVSMGFGVNVKSISVGGTNSFEIWGVYITPVQVVIIASAIVILALLAFAVHSTSLGRRIRALREHSFAAQSIGVCDWAVNFSVFTIAIVLAAYAGVLIGIETNLQPTMGNSYTMKAFAAMILGGLGNIWGTVIGSFILGLVENLSIGLDFGSYSIPAGYKDAFAFMIILLVLLVRPSGLFGKRVRTV